MTQIHQRLIGTRELLNGSSATAVSTPGSSAFRAAASAFGYIVRPLARERSGHRKSRESGLHIEGPVDSFSQKVDAVTRDELTGRFSRIVLAVKAHHTVAAVTALQPHLTDDGFVLSAQNGLNERGIAHQLGERRCMGVFVNFGADLLEPGRVLFGNRGAVAIGELDGQRRARTEAMLELFRLFGIRWARPSQLVIRMPMIRASQAA